MSSGKYKFNPDKLHYSQLENNLKNRVLKISAFVMASLVIAFVILVCYSLIFDTPREREDRQENEALSQDYIVLSQKFERVDTVLQELKNIDENIYRTIFETEPLGGHTTRNLSFEDYAYLLSHPNDVIVDYDRFRN